jgi:hypothetical protein
MSENDAEHPAARNADQLAWAIWVGEELSDSEVVAVTADSEAAARERALDRADGGEVVHVDGPFQDGDPGVWEFEFVTEHRETVVVEAPTEDYAAESADSERTYRGEYVQTTHTECRRLSTIVEDADE